ncbi:LOW QUALITY PROTEIN: uncharacterized protein LOC143297198 [Babylonia areolata]|uniref:LOW QUALITY PROTEIN: uncharacterized protein LOC143297198 n=1 Tax=Babylonia areolata TaxID=304850 RepID=UPI003FD1F6B6
MEQLIQNANFMHTEDDDLMNEFKDSLSGWDSDSVSFPQLQACFKATQRQICRPDFPRNGSSGYYMGYHLIDTLISLADDLCKEGKAKAVDVNEMYLGFILQMVQIGPLSSHTEYIKMLMSDSDVEFEEFFQSLKGERLKKIVLSLKKDYKPDPGMECSSYFSNDFDRFWTCFVSDGLSEEQFHEARLEFIQLYTFFSTAFVDRDRDTFKTMRDAADTINRKFDRNIFKGQPVSLLQEQWAVLSKLVLAPGFPQSEDVGKEIKDVMEELLKVVSEEKLLGSMYEGIMDLALALTVQKAGCQGTHRHFEAMGYFFRDVEEKDVKGDSKLYEGLMTKFLHFLNHVDDKVYLTLKFVQPVMYECLNNAMGKSEGHVRLWVDMIKALLQHPVPECLGTARRAMREKDSIIKWKKYPEDLRELFTLLGGLTFPRWLTEKQVEAGNKQLEDLTKDVLKEAEKVGVTKLGLTEPIVQLTFHYLEGATEESYSLAEILADKVEFNPKKDKALIMDTLQRATTYLEDESYDWDDEKLRDMGYALRDLVIACIDCVKDGKVFTLEEYDELIYLVKLSEKKMHQVAEPGSSNFFMIYTVVGMNITNWLQTMNEEHRLIPMVPCMVSMLEYDDSTVLSTVTAHMMVLSRSAGYMFARYNEKLVDKFLEDESSEVLVTITCSYEYNKGPIERRFDELFEHIDSGNTSVHSNILELLAKVAKHQPHLFSQDKVDAVVKEAKEDSGQQVQLLNILVDLARRHIDRLEPSMDDFMNVDLWQEFSAPSVVNILQLYALQSEEKADKVISYLMTRIQRSESYTEVLVALNACRRLGFKHRPAIEKHRAAIEKFRDSTGNSDYHLGCASILDMLDGKSVDKIADELRELQGDVADLEVRVTATETDIAEVKDTVQQQGEDLDNVKNEVNEQGQRLDKVEDTVEDTKVKVQEIDGKTLSHAPSWARDVSKLLNVEADADWRLLSLRLGFTNDDLRAWATTADPCLAMLNEWYATHKTREATHAVLTSLQLLDREDAAVIVENAMKNAEEVVEDEEFEYATPPDVFISYQWGHQAEVRVLRQHLEMAGFSCWMDVGQMGGGDKLFEKIDSGIRGAKVVLSCVSAKYAKSPNCNREVNLSVNLGKPIIPLLMEKVSWPPPGSMGPIFSEYLFIRFFQRAGEETERDDQRYWPLPKFQELLMQLSVNGLMPDQRVVQPEYQDWWLPKVEEVTIDKDRSKKQSAATSTTTSSAPGTEGKQAEAEVSPEVFISYQWGKQPQILKLYSALTSRGYTCWLDIMQMGGGDSLYDKIDRGLRGCHVALCCVTTKYAKSANCRREVSLADAVQKPVVPLLLEKEVSWPPPGPMGPVMTQLLYIDCTQGDTQLTWTGPKFDELLAAIDRHVPGKGKGEGEGEAAEKVPESQQKEKEKEEKKKEEKITVVDVAPVAQEKQSETASAPKSQGETNGDGGERTDGSPHNNHHPPPAAPQEKPDSGMQDARGGKQEHAGADIRARKTSLTSTADGSMAGHDECNYGQQQLYLQKDGAASACCVIL